MKVIINVNFAKKDALGNVIRDEPEWKTRNKQVRMIAREGGEEGDRVELY